MKLLFANTYFYRFDSKQWNNKQPYPPLATIQAAAFLREKGHDVSLFDTNLIIDPSLIESKLDDESPEVLIIYDDGFNYLTKMCLTKMREAAFDMCGYAKKRNIKTIVCSSDSSDHYDEYLNKHADFILIGEGEITLNELIDQFQNNTTDYNQISGIAYLEKDQVVKTAPRPVLQDLDMLPIPAWDLINMEEYRTIWKKNHGYFSLNMATTRGCPYKCNWCAKPIYGNRYNSRSAEKVAGEIEMLIDTYGVEHFWMCDDIFGLKPKWAGEFEKAVNEKNLSFRYKIQSRVDLLLKEDNINALCNSGLEEVWVGAESGSQEILDAMDKGTKVEQIYEATRLLKKNKVRVCFFLQFGYLGETKEDIDKTLNMVLELMPEDIGVSVSYPLPGTKFYDKVKSELVQKANWSDSDDLDLMFSNTFSSEYYKRLHRYMHKKYRKKQGFQTLKSIFKNPAQWKKYGFRAPVLSTFYYTPALLMDKYKLKKLEKTS